SEWAHLLAVDSDPSDQIVVLEHGYAEQRACAGHIRKFESGWITVEIGLLLCNVCNVLHLLRSSDTRKGAYRARGDHGVTPPQFGKCGRRAVHCNESEHVSLVQEQVTEFGLAYPHCIRQHGVEHRLKRSWRRADDTEDFRRRRLLLKGLGQLARSCLHLLKEARILDGDDGLVSEGFQKSDLLVGEERRDGACHRNPAYRLAVSHQRHGQEGADVA